MKREYTDVEVFEKYEKLSAPKKIDVLMGALDYKEQYNGRSDHWCIVLSMRDIYDINLNLDNY